MNKNTCPTCNKSLSSFWGNGTTSKGQIDTEGKRWYQYAGPSCYCKHCDGRLRDRFANYKLPAFAFWFLIVSPYIIQPLYKNHGVIIFLPVAVFGLFLVMLLERCKRYENWIVSGKDEKIN
jgi:hypothetical protein